MSKKTLWIINVLVLIWISHGYPLGSRNGIEVPSPEVLNFMRRFGYLDKNPDNSEALYHESAIVEAVKNIQKYGALNQTGELDSMTLELFTKPRCGVPDIEGKPYYLRQQSMLDKDAKRREKRFIFGAKTWSKRNIKYLIGNRSLKIPREQVERDIARAFAVWAQYSNLKFERVEDTSADIIVGFGSQYHGDNFPFDGSGNILAHAFYPYEMGSWGGDVHFDEDEDWKENSPELSQGVDFYTVALHELGHSLGLAHSPTFSSIMFPYYKGPDHNVLDYDDTLAMYNAYLNKKLDDDVEVVNEDNEEDEEEEEEEEEEENVEEGNSPYYDTTEYTTVIPDQNENKEDIGQNSNNFFNTSSSATDNSVARSYDSPSIPNVCEGRFNAVCYFNGFVHIFKGQYVWKLSSYYRVITGYPKRLQDVIKNLPETINEIDACYERYDKTVVFFTGTQIWHYKDDTVVDSSPVALENMLGNVETVDRIDAALLWPKNNLTYIFAGSIFWRYNDRLQRLDDGYPKSVQRWPGVPENIDAAATIPNGKTYFFKDNLYWLYDNLRVRPERGYPRRTSTAWLGCTTRTTKMPFRNNTTTVSFISVSPSSSSRV